jgi:hypothetical protein
MPSTPGIPDTPGTSGTPGAPGVEALDTAVDRAADRLRAAPESRLRRGAAAAGLRVARELAVRAQVLEHPAGLPRELPDAGIHTVGDQLAVAGHDLAQALREHPDEPAAGRELTTALELLREL